ncbi:hypothetical protein NDU88_001977 [Pleurodeles waltl]|uniref:Uncharacterized protein n=1 Tax=Pleurodeles waltl TaxID=8319 RepID=A0AAV7T1V7_PLEWA|nr:hypothetical protein NDU88_001977 [Pleurodeles waltl]
MTGHLPNRRACCHCPYYTENLKQASPRHRNQSQIRLLYEQMSVALGDDQKGWPCKEACLFTMPNPESLYSPSVEEPPKKMICCSQTDTFTVKPDQPKLRLQVTNRSEGSIGERRGDPFCCFQNLSFQTAMKTRASWRLRSAMPRLRRPKT